MHETFPAALEASRSAHLEQVSPHHPQIERHRQQQMSFLHLLIPSQVGSSSSPGLAHH